MMLLEQAPTTTRYRNPWPWRVMPPEQAAEGGFFDRSFSNKKQALAYQKLVKSQYPEEPCCLVHTGRYFDVLGRAYDSRE
jgi:hypothetical protein